MWAVRLEEPMSHRLATLLVLLAAGCAGGDLMRADSEGSALAEEDAGSGTGGAEPVTTGLTSLSGGTQSSDGTTTSQPGQDADSDPATAEDGSSTGAFHDGSSDTGDTGDTGDTDDSGGESGSSTTAVDPPEDSVDLSGWTVVQTGSDRTFTLPPGTVLPAGAVLVLGRDATRGAFEEHWGALDGDVLYVNSEDSFPAINGEETFSLRDAADATIDGPTSALENGQALTRTDVSGPGTWTAAGENTAAPGVGHDFSGTSGVFITEVSDATGPGSYVYEFIELQGWP